VSFAGPFWQMREWCGFEGLCMMMIDAPDMVAEMAEFYTNFVSEMLRRVFEQIVPDVIHISEDMAYKEKAMISPQMTRRFCTPSWVSWTEQAKSTGVPIIDMDSDGFIGELIPIWIEAGINVCDPIEVAAGNNINEFRGRFGRGIAYRMGIDKRAMAAGGQVIRDELNRIEPVVKDGGFIPGCDHGVPSDVSWGNFVDYARLLAEMTGWL
jgi:uroporphyrinogen decarboxylase